MPYKYFVDCGDCKKLQSPYDLGIVFDIIVSVKQKNNMITLTIEGHFFYKFECVLTDSYMANSLLKMLSSIHKDETYSVKNIEIETDKEVLGKEYDVCDNSYCINLTNGKYVGLVQREGPYYSPDKDEKGAKFIIIKKPYIKKVTDAIGSLYHIFINVVSTKTGNFYRVIYNENCVLA